MVGAKAVVDRAEVARTEAEVATKEADGDEAEELCCTMPCILRPMN